MDALQLALLASGRIPSDLTSSKSPKSAPLYCTQVALFCRTASLNHTYTAHKIFLLTNTQAKMKGDNTYVQNQYGQDQVHAQQQAPVYNDTSRGYQQQQPQAYGAVGNMGAPHHQQQPHVVGGAHGSVQPIYVVDGQRPGSENCASNTRSAGIFLLMVVVALDIVLYIVALFLPPASV